MIKDIAVNCIAINRTMIKGIAVNYTVLNYTVRFSPFSPMKLPSA